MIERKDLGSWMDGPPVEPDYVPGSAIGLPADGPGSPASFWRRAASLWLDWMLCLVVAYLLPGNSPLMANAVFAVVNIGMLTLFGATPAQFLLGLRVRPVTGQQPMVIRALLRTVLMHLVIPGVIWNRDRQPLHDVAAGTAVVRV